MKTVQNVVPEWLRGLDDMDHLSPVQDIQNAPTLNKKYLSIHAQAVATQLAKKPGKMVSFGAVIRIQNVPLRSLEKLETPHARNAIPRSWSMDQEQD